MKKLSILIVEDNPGDVLLIKEYLSEKRSFAVDLHEAENLAASFDLLSTYDFDVVLLDLSLPDSSGMETVRKVVGNFPEIPVIVLTGLQDEKTARLAIRFGAQDYLDKGCLSPEILSRAIIYAIERKKAFQDKEELLDNLAQALEKITALEGILPLCINCKKIMDAEHQWHTVEEYIVQRSDMKIVPLVCPLCKNDMSLNDHTQ